MSTPLIWILFPGLLSGLLLILNRWQRLVVVISTLAAALLAIMAWWLPVNEPLSLGSLSLEVVDTWSVFGRRFILGENDRPALVVLFLAAAFWCGGSYAARTRRSFVPLALAMIALLTAAIAVEPFLYAAMLIELAVLVSIPFLAPPEESIGRGVLRYLTFQTLGAPFILFSGWILTGVESSPGAQDLGARAAILIGLGFAFLLAVFPFHSWVPMLAQDAHPYAVTFIFLLLPGAITFFGLGFLDRYAWLRDFQELYLLLRLVGVTMVFVMGLWAAFQRHLGRILGYAVLIEIGFTLVSTGLTQGDQTGTFLEILFASLLPRGLALGLWALALSIIRSQAEDLYYRDVQGIARRAPIAVGGLIFAHFTLVGLPLTAGFPVRLALWENLAQVSPLLSIWAFLGSVGLLVGGLRTLVVAVMGKEEEPWQTTEDWMQQSLLIIGMMALLIVGLFPQWFLPFFADMARAFEHLIP